jgi:hypothetical protein
MAMPKEFGRGHTPIRSVQNGIAIEKGFESCVPEFGGGGSYADFSEDFKPERFLSIAEKSSFI